MVTTAPPSQLETAVDAFYASMDKGEKVAMTRVAVAHNQLVASLTKELEVLKKLDPLNPLDAGSTSMIQRQRLSTLLLQATASYEEFADQINLAIPKTHKEAVALANANLNGLVDARDPSGIAAGFSRLNREQTLQAVAVLNDGSPFREITASYGPEASKELNRIYLESVNMGYGFEATARKMMGVSDITRARAETLVRTEHMRATREVTRRAFMANSDIIKGWEWYSRRDRNCCPVCWAMHGTTHKNETRMATHPNCRCLMLPVLKTYKEMGLDIEEAPTPWAMQTMGVDQFRNLSKAEQRSILGKGAFMAYDNGLIDLPDFIGESYSPKWGAGRYRKPLKDIVGADNAKLLSQGKVPLNFVNNPTKHAYSEALPGFDNPLQEGMDYLEAMRAAGKVDDLTYDLMTKNVDTGIYPDSAAMKKLIDDAYDGTKGGVEAQIWNLYHDGHIDDALRQDLLANLDTYTIEQLEETSKLLTELEEAVIQQVADNDALKFQMIGDTTKRLIKIKDHGSLTYSEYQSLQTELADLAYKDFEMFDFEVIHGINQKLDAVYTINHPRAKALHTVNQAMKNGQLDSVTGQDMLDWLKDPLNNGKITEFEAISSSVKKIVSGDIPTFGDILSVNPTMASKLDSLLNNKQISQKHYDFLKADWTNGTNTIKDFGNKLDDLATVNPVGGISKNSWALKNELQMSSMPDVQKKMTLDLYNQQKLSKGEMDAIIKQWPPKPKAPTPQPSYTPPSYGTPSTGGLPPKVNVPGQPGYDPLLNEYGKPKALLDESEWKFINPNAPSPGGAPLPRLQPSANAQGPLPKPGKGPYKKHQDKMADLVNYGDLQQSEVDEILQWYDAGRIKNKDIEIWLDDIAKAKGPGSGSVTGAGGRYIPGRKTLWDSTMSADDIANFSFDRHEWGTTGFRDVFDRWKKNSTKEAVAIAKDYTGSLYGPLNKFLRSGRAGYGSTDYHKKADKLLDSMEHATLDKPIRVSRGTTMSKEYDWANAEAGDLLMENGFMSTTTKATPDFSDHSYGPDRVGVRIIAYLPRGAHAIDLRQISNYKSEEEVLIPPGSIFRVKKRESRGGNDITLYLDWVGYEKDEVFYKKVKP